MAYNYDELYASTPDALGKPTQVFVDFFARNTQPNLRVLDVGCGQGRDAIFVAKQGHSVVGVDLSPHGIADLNAVAADAGLDIIGIAQDIVTFAPDGTFDIVLIDRTLHMLDLCDRLDVLARLVAVVRPSGWLLIADEPSHMPAFKDLIDNSGVSWATTLDNRGTLFLRRS